MANSNKHRESRDISREKYMDTSNNYEETLIISRENRRSNTKKTVLALLVGTAVGAGIGLLYAPSSGKETRKRIGETTKDAQEKLNRQIRDTTNTVANTATGALRSIEHRVEDTLSNVKRKADTLIDSMEGKLEELRRQNKKFEDIDSSDDFEPAATPGTPVKNKTKSSVVADTPNSPTVAPTKKIVSS